MNTPDLWVERYRPNGLDGYVFKNEKIREQVLSWVKNLDNKQIPFPHLLLSGGPGTGKTTLAKAMLNELGVSKHDILLLNGSRERGIDVFRDQVRGFCSTYPVGEYKVVFIDEADYLTRESQALLRNELEKFADSVRFIFTCNVPRKIIPALHSRCQAFHFDELDMESFFGRILEILNAENVSYDIDDLELYVNNSYPDLRKCINLLDQHTISGKLSGLQEGAASDLNYMESAVALFKAGRYTDARKLILQNADANDYEDIFKFMYKNLQLFGDSDEQQSQAVIIIARGLRNHIVAADAEINLSATICELSQLGKI